MTIKIDLPKNVCRYELYDPNNLAPLNDSTTIRLIETGWNKHIFSGKTVLDIGCNSGALSIFAVQNGAESVKAVDVQEELVQFFSAVVEKHDLPISVEKRSLEQLTVEEHQADVVLCMEVLHWIVHQGGTVATAIAKLASLTRERLFIETPWDVNEPSIKNRADYPAHEYDIERIFKELSKHFQNVEFKKFMTYFGDMKDSKRVLIEAKNKHVGSLGARHISDGNLSGISMSRGSNESFLVTTRSGPKVLKRIANYSVFNKLNEKDCCQLGEFLSTPLANKIIAGPLCLGDKYVQTESDGYSYMLFPFVGSLEDYFPEKRNLKGPSAPLSAVVNLTKYLSSAPEELIKKIQEVTNAIQPFDTKLLPNAYREPFEINERIKFIQSMNECLVDYDRALEDSILHFDMQLGNFVPSSDGVDYIVDLDLIRTGPLYSDFLSCVIYLAPEKKKVLTEFDKLMEGMHRKSSDLDVAVAVSSCLRWLNTRLNHKPSLSDSKFKQFLAGLDLVIDLHANGKLY